MELTLERARLMIAEARKVKGWQANHAREYAAYLETAIKRYSSLKSLSAKHEAFASVIYYANRLEADLPKGWEEGKPKP